MKWAIRLWRSMGRRAGGDAFERFRGYDGTDPASGSKG
jgi:hypothetical protein